ncbi:hypothetical protein Asppvi_010756 [Aspergillus pseudoviridinutans]|uniref:Uncharacterized protein n=1 Tax=Aspergillus pseudoviridinutans TaxID=1517512 RepID=A0A9P3BMT8_9EURO|nr:uncharacterized protein Asppvi_010756 [Aspergillus pseudoviridinutans]GIJ91783.1 hypothetical protein Asppvi_010756 [Aspergillus pseudoviridinutans]
MPTRSPEDEGAKRQASEELTANRHPSVSSDTIEHTIVRDGQIVYAKGVTMAPWDILGDILSAPAPIARTAQWHSEPTTQPLPYSIQTTISCQRMSLTVDETAYQWELSNKTINGRQYNQPAQSERKGCKGGHLSASREGLNGELKRTVSFNRMGKGKGGQSVGPEVAEAEAEAEPPVGERCAEEADEVEEAQKPEASRVISAPDVERHLNTRNTKWVMWP